MHLKTEVSAGFTILSNNLLTNSEKKATSHYKYEANNKPGG
jgi:hypothetical protein